VVQVICKTCMTTALVADGQDVHVALECACCPGDHHHGQEAGACPRVHDGPCWQGPQAGPRPDGCTVCRPVLVLAGAAMTLTGG
jgi:hypothetical protein